MIERELKTGGNKVEKKGPRWRASLVSSILPSTVSYYGSGSGSSGEYQNWVDASFGDSNVCVKKAALLRGFEVMC